MANKTFESYLSPFYTKPKSGSILSSSNNGVLTDQQKMALMNSYIGGGWNTPTTTQQTYSQPQQQTYSQPQSTTSSTDQLIEALVRGGYNRTDAINTANGPRAAELAREYGVGGGDDIYTDPNAYINSIMDSLTAPLKEAQERAKKYDEENPFSFDEILAKSSAEERYNPFYEAELRDYLSGVYRQRSASTQDEARLLSQLVADTESYNKRTQRNLENTISSSEQGYAGSGLYESGERRRETGLVKTDTQQTLSDYIRQQEDRAENIKLGTGRTLAELAAQESTQRRKIGAEKETAIRTDVEEQRKEQLQQRELERQSIVGYPLTTGMSSLSSIYGI